MSEPSKTRIQLFDPQQELAVIERRLPHWSQAGTIAFLTWRTWDSIPSDRLQQWITERNDWLRTHGIEPKPNAAVSCGEMSKPHKPKPIPAHPTWRTRLQSLPPALRREFRMQISNRWNDCLDECHGQCVLRQAELSQIVADSLLHFDGSRYDLTDFVVMPNHVHLLAAFPDEESMLEQCDSWKHFTATKLNRALRRRGRFWQQDGFDHLVRSFEQFEFLRRYIADNPHRAKLAPGEFVHFSKPT
jgi:type I restriction enzyme R subunit